MLCRIALWDWLLRLAITNREEKSLRHVPMVAKFLDDLKQRIRTVSNLIDLIQFQLKFVKCWRNFLGLSPKGPYLSLDIEKKFCVVFTYFIKQAREIRKFHVAVVQRRLRNVQKSVIHE